MREINGTVENVCVPWLTHYCLGYSYIYTHIYKAKKRPKI